MGGPCGSSVSGESRSFSQRSLASERYQIAKLFIFYLEVSSAPSAGGIIDNKFLVLIESEFITLNSDVISLENSLHWILM